MMEYLDWRDHLDDPVLPVTLDVHVKHVGNDVEVEVVTELKKRKISYAVLLNNKE